MAESRGIGAAGATARKAQMESRVLIVIPAYNEQDCILRVVEEVRGAGYDYVVVNDGSTDGTLEVCRAGGVNVLDLPQNLGIGGAVQAGHKYAQMYGYDIDIQFDGDGQHDIAYVPALVEAIGRGADLAIGSRFVEKTDGFQSTRLRRAGISWLTFWIRLFAGKKVTDPTSGFRACSRRTIDLFCASYPIDYPEPESVALAAKMGLSVVDVPVVMRERKTGSSSIGGLSSLYYMVKVSLAIAIVCVTRRGLQRAKG